ncbi:MAG: cyclic nucleotide-binding domain-containing protein [Desulfobacterales bacterium]|nr:cyclic nucleotide-binding domain-containing protein [Desulfobacterales bacterium]
MVTNNELLSILRESTLFKGISDDLLDKITAYGELLNFSKDDCLIEEGQVGHPLNIILAGQVEVFLPKERRASHEERPTRIVLDRLNPGDCIGEYSFIDKKPASASVIANEPGRAFRLTRHEFEEIVTSSNHMEKTIYKNMLKVLIHRCRQSDSELDICY